MSAICSCQETAFVSFSSAAFYSTVRVRPSAPSLGFHKEGCMRKLPWTISVGHRPDEWVFLVNQTQEMKAMTLLECEDYSRRLTYEIQARYNALRGMDTKRLFDAPTVRSLLYDARFFFNS